MTSAFILAADDLERELALEADREKPSRWYCNRPDCDGEPHEGWHFCEHPIINHPTGSEYWRCRHARASQHPPSGEWRYWMVMAGRGWGKTRTGAEWLADQARRWPGTTWAVGAPTRESLKTTCFEDEAGILQALGMGRFDPAYNRSDLSIHLPNGSVIYSYSGESPERSRGPNLAGAWLDELGSWRYRETWDTMAPALRRADAKVVITTTPRAVPLVKEFYHRDGDGSVIVTKGSMDENASNLSQGTLDDLRLRWAGTRWGRQELGGELIEVIEGALWDPDNIAANRVPRPEGTRDDPFGVQELYERIQPTRIVIAVDPALSFTENSDEHGIIVAAKGGDGHVYILEDLSRRCPVTAWPEIVIEAHARWQVDRVVAEQNAGYDYIGVQLKAAGYRGGYEKVNARRGKLLRAAPVATYYEQNKVHHVGEFPQLESQMCMFVPDEMSNAPGVDDRVDAMVYAVAWLEPRLISGWGSVYTPFTDEEKANMPTTRSNWARVYAKPEEANGNGNGSSKPKGGYFG